MQNPFTDAVARKRPEDMCAPCVPIRLTYFILFHCTLKKVGRNLCDLELVYSYFPAKKPQWLGPVAV